MGLPTEEQLSAVQFLLRKDLIHDFIPEFSKLHIHLHLFVPVTGAVSAGFSFTISHSKLDARAPSTSAVVSETETEN